MNIYMKFKTFQIKFDAQTECEMEDAIKTLVLRSNKEKILNIEVWKCISTIHNTCNMVVVMH